MERSADDAPSCLISKLDGAPSRILPIDKTERFDFAV